MNGSQRAEDGGRKLVSDEMIADDADPAIVHDNDVEIVAIKSSAIEYPAVVGSDDTMVSRWHEIRAWGAHILNPHEGHQKK